MSETRQDPRRGSVQRFIERFLPDQSTPMRSRELRRALVLVAACFVFGFVRFGGAAIPVMRGNPAGFAGHVVVAVLALCLPLLYRRTGNFRLTANLLFLLVLCGPIMLSLDLGGMENFTVAILSTTPMFMVLIAGTPGTLFRAAVALGVVYGFTFTFGPPYAVDGVDSLARMKIAVVLGATLLCAFCVALAFIQEREIEATVSKFERASEEAQAASIAKSEFLANMSHELRTPMNGVIGMLDILLMSELEDEDREFAQTAYTSANSLLALLNDILDLSKIEAGRMELEPMPCDLRDTCGSVLSTLEAKANESRLALQLELEAEVPPVCEVDELRLRQILTNLVGNAIKFTHEGGVYLTVGRRGAPSSASSAAALVTFSVRDTGIGIEGEALERVFDKFAQADNSTTRKYGGTGLGLAITKQLAERMGGELEVESEVGVGSTFRLVLPMPIVDDPERWDESQALIA